MAVLKPTVVKVLRSLRDQTDGQDALLTSKIILFTLARHGRLTAGRLRCSAACMGKHSASDPRTGATRLQLQVKREAEEDWGSPRWLKNRKQTAVTRGEY